MVYRVGVTVTVTVGGASRLVELGVTKTYLFPAGYAPQQSS